jgi:hypothetical protein
MKIEEHHKAFDEHERNIRRCIDEGIADNQRNLGYNISQASIELLSIYLLKLKLVTVSINFDHRIFKSSDAIKTKISFDFPEKSKILDVMKRVEEKRNILCYGKRKTIKEIEEMIKLYNDLKMLLVIQ